MSFYLKLGMRFFSQPSERLITYFPDLRPDLRKARMKTSVQEYISKALLTSLIVFICELPFLSFIFSLIFQSFLFGFITAFTASIFIAAGFFFVFVNYPKTVIKEREKKIDGSLPFASLYLSTIAGSKLPLHQILDVFSRFSRYGQITDEIGLIIRDMDAFGIDVNTSLERAIERTPSKNLKELLWGILSINRGGGEVDVYLKEKAKTFLAEYRRKVYEFSHNLTVMIEVFITAVILSAVFFTILTSIMSGIAGTTGNIIILQFLLIFFFIPLISAAFLILIKAMSPTGE